MLFTREVHKNDLQDPNKERLISVIPTEAIQKDVVLCPSELIWDSLVQTPTCWHSNRYSDLLGSKKIRQKNPEINPVRTSWPNRIFIGFFSKVLPDFFKQNLASNGASPDLFSWSSNRIFIGFFFRRFGADFYRIFIGFLSDLFSDLFPWIFIGFLSDFYSVEQNISLFIKNVLWFPWSLE